MLLIGLPGMEVEVGMVSVVGIACWPDRLVPQSLQNLALR